MDPKTLIGKTEAEAVDLIKEAKFKPRIVSRDGVVDVVTADARGNRMNLEIAGGKVTGAFIG